MGKNKTSLNAEACYINGGAKCLNVASYRFIFTRSYLKPLQHSATCPSKQYPQTLRKKQIYDYIIWHPSGSIHIYTICILFITKHSQTIKLPSLKRLKLTGRLFFRCHLCISPYPSSSPRYVGWSPSSRHPRPCVALVPRPRRRVATRPGDATDATWPVPYVDSTSG